MILVLSFSSSNRQKAQLQLRRPRNFAAGQPRSWIMNRIAWHYDDIFVSDRELLAALTEHAKS